MKKKIVSFLLAVIFIFTSASYVFVSAGSQDLENPDFLLNPATGEFLPVTDRTKEIEEITKEQPVDLIFEEKFEAAAFKRRINSEDSTAVLENQASVPPVPGGVGYGVFYNNSFMDGFTNGTSISHDILCPTKPGGNVNTYLYLTSTNRSTKGVEAFILYYGQNDLQFRVFDWSRPEEEHWQVTIPYVSMSRYLRTKTVHGTSYQYVTVQNSTELVSGTTWRNSVFLGNNTGGYDLIYQHDYTSSTAEQKFDNDWGPIVETFQDSYSNVNPMGFDAAYLRSADAAGQWSNWTLLTSSQSRIRIDNKGFNLIFLDPNYAFAVR